MKFKYDKILGKLRESDALIPGTGLAVDPDTGEVSVVGGGESANAVTMTTSERTALVLGEGVLVWDTDLEKLFIGDGSTAGGIEIEGGGGGGTSYVFDAEQFTVSGDSVSITGTVPSATTAMTANGVAASAVDYRMTVSSGAASFNPVANIVNATGATVTLEPDTAYKVQATTSAVTLNANPPAAGQWGLEGHIEIFVANTGYVVTGSNVVLANALEPDAVNNCTVRFHDGMAIISVEDHVAGYIVTVNAASGAGSLNYGLATASNGYISFNASLNGQTLDLGGVVTSAGEKHVVGNGYTETILSGGLNCTSKTTFANLGMDGVIVSSGTLTLGDVYIPNGATVAVSGGGLAIERVTGNGGVVNLGAEYISSGRVYASGCSFTGSGGSHNGGAVFAAATNTLSATFDDCNFVSCVAKDGSANGGAIALMSTGNSVHISGGVMSGCSGNKGGAVFLAARTPILLEDVKFVSNVSLDDGGAVWLQPNDITYTTQLKRCYFEGNSCGTTGAAISVLRANCALTDCTFNENQTIRLQVQNGRVTLIGSNVLKSVIDHAAFNSGYVTISSGAIIDLTGNTNATPINPGFSVVVSGGCTVINSAGTSVAIAGGTYTKINNDGTTA